MEYKKTESKRKTVSIEINTAGEVTVRCPFGYPDVKIKKLLEDHKERIEKAKERINSRRQAAASQAEKIQTMYYLGKAYAIVAENGRHGCVEHDSFLVSTGTEKQDIERFCREKAEAYMKDKTAYWASIVGKAPTSVKITAAAHRWGSASTKMHICYPWRIILLPPHLIDSIVVHELCHLWEHNHAAAFYRRVEAILPDYREREKELRLWETKLKQEGFYHGF